MEPLDGIAGADALLGRSFPLPALPLPLTRWTQVAPEGAGVEVEWNLDDTRPGSPGRLALYAGAEPAPDRELPGPVSAQATLVGTLPARLRSAPLDDAQPSLRPVRELVWEQDGLSLRLTAQGPWELDDLLALAASIGRGAAA